MYLFDRLLEFFGYTRVLGARVIRRWSKVRKPQPAPAPVVINKSVPVEHLLNDPTTPHLKQLVEIEKPSGVMKFDVVGFVGGGHAMGTEQWRAANVYVGVDRCLRLMDKYIASFGGRPLVTWAAGPSLRAIPAAGQDLNAFYDRRTMQFFYAPDPSRGNHSVFLADSAEIVTHELGHAVLDALRPDTWNVAFLEVWSFHETFADFTSMICLMQYDQVLDEVLAKTGGNLRSPSVVTELAEDFGQLIYRLTGGADGRSAISLRSAINGFKYVHPSTLPQEAPHDQLAAEPHSFGRVFLGALYEILVRMYEQGVKEGLSPRDALTAARDTLAVYVLKAVQNVPLVPNFYHAMATTVLWADYSTTKKYHDLMMEVFLDRNLVQRQLKMLAVPPAPEGKGCVLVEKPIRLRLSDVILRAQSQDQNELYDVEIEASNDEAYLYDADGSVYDSVSSNDSEVVGAAQDFVIFLHERSMVGQGKPFAVEEGRLSRLRIV